MQFKRTSDITSFLLQESCWCRKGRNVSQASKEVPQKTKLDRHAFRVNSIKFVINFES